MKMNKNEFGKVAMFTSVFILILIGVLATFNMDTTKTEYINYSEFLTLVDKGEVKSIIVTNESPLEVTLMDDKLIKTDNPNSPLFKQEMLEKGIKVTQFTESSNSAFGTIINILFIVIAFTLLFKFLGKGTQNMFTKYTKARTTTNLSANGRVVTFKDVEGAEEAKEEMWEIIEFLKQPKRFLSMGARLPKGVLLHGPAGTGKTLLARAVAGEAGVPFYSISGSDFVELFVGVGASRVRDLFETARKNSPAVIFIDEIDAVGKKRGGHSNGNDERDQTLNQILTELDGFTSSEGIIIIGATNRLDTLDSALLRPGRFDRHIEVGYPDFKGRLSILKLHAKNKPLSKEVDLEKLARRTIQFTGAELENILNESTLFAIRNKRKQILWEDIDSAFNRIVAGPKKVRNNLSEEEKRTVAYHEAGHAIITQLLAKLKVDKVTIQPSGKALGYVLRVPEDNHLRSKKDFFNDICIAMGGRVAEEIINGKENITSGASNDFKQATKIAYQMVSIFGMSELGPISIDGDQEMWYRLSDDIKNKAFKEVQEILRQAEKETLEFLKENEDYLRRLALHLLEVETIQGEELEGVLLGEVASHIDIEVKEVKDSKIRDISLETSI